MSDLFKVIAAGLGIAGAWYLRLQIDRYVQMYLDWLARSQIDDAKKKAEQDAQKLSEALRAGRPTDGAV